MTVTPFELAALLFVAGLSGAVLGAWAKGVCDE